jgi:hypothetical protein
MKWKKLRHLVLEAETLQRKQKWAVIASGASKSLSEN